MNLGERFLPKCSAVVMPDGLLRLPNFESAEFWTNSIMSIKSIIVRTDIQLPNRIKSSQRSYRKLTFLNRHRFDVDQFFCRSFIIVSAAVFASQ